MDKPTKKALIVTLIVIACMVATLQWGWSQTYVPASGAGRIWTVANLPATAPTNFKNFDQLYVVADSSYYQRVSGTWVKSYLKNGKDGKDGRDGQAGSNGAQGAAGQAATVTVGTTITLPAGSQATVTNSGTSSNAVLNFGIPQGAQGTSGGGGSLPTTVGTTRFCYTESDLRNAIAGIATNAVKNIQIMQDIRITGSTPLSLPKTQPLVYEEQILIGLNGNSLYDNSPSGLPYLIGMQPTDQVEAMSMANKPRSYRIHGGRMVGKGAATGCLIDLACAQRSVVENMYLENANKGVRMAFCMFGEVRNITSSDIYSILVEPTRGEWPGSGNNLCSSNQFKVSNVRAFVRDGMKAIIWSRACSGHKYELITGEGGYAEYGIYWDYNGANEVKNGPEINLCHWEGSTAAQFSQAFIYIRQGGGSTTTITATNHQLFGGSRSPLIWVQGEGGGNTVNVNSLSWLIADSKFQSGGQNFWQFKDCYDGANLFTQSRWVGTIPNGQSVYNNGTSVQTVKKP